MKITVGQWVRFKYYNRDRAEYKTYLGKVGEDQGDIYFYLPGIQHVIFNKNDCILIKSAEDLEDLIEPKDIVEIEFIEDYYKDFPIGSKFEGIVKHHLGDMLDFGHVAFHYGDFKITAVELYDNRNIQKTGE